MKRGLKKKGQIWIETVIYTLITLVLIGLVLGVVKPKIEEYRDHAAIERTISIIKEIDSSIKDIIVEGAGNKRVIEFNLGGGELKIDGVNNDIIFEIDSRYEYSEPGESFSDGGFDIMTENKGKYKKVTITKSYSQNLTYNSLDELKTISASSTSYRMILSNKGYSGDVALIDIIVN